MCYFVRDFCEAEDGMIRRFLVKAVADCVVMVVLVLWSRVSISAVSFV